MLTSRAMQTIRFGSKSFVPENLSKRTRSAAKANANSAELRVLFSTSRRAAMEGKSTDALPPDPKIVREKAIDSAQSRINSAQLTMLLCGANIGACGAVLALTETLNSVASVSGAISISGVIAGKLLTNLAVSDLKESLRADEK